MKLIDKVRELIRGGNRPDNSVTVVEQAVNCKGMSHAELFDSIMFISHEQTGYQRLNRDNRAVLFAQIDDIGEDISVIEFIPAESLLKLEIEDEVETMGDFLNENGIDVEKTRTRRVAVVAICDSISSELLNIIKKSTYEEPVGFPPQSCYNLSICACIDPACNLAIFSPRTQLLKRQYQALIDDIVELVLLCV